MSRPLALAVSLLLGLAPRAAWADSFGTPALRTGAATSVQGYGQQNPRCLEWTDGCVVCLATNGHARCSTPGIACTPAGLTCKRPSRP